MLEPKCYREKDSTKPIPEKLKTLKRPDRNMGDVLKPVSASILTLQALYHYAEVKGDVLIHTEYIIILFDERVILSINNLRIAKTKPTTLMKTIL